MKVHPITCYLHISLTWITIGRSTCRHTNQTNSYTITRRRKIMPLSTLRVKLMNYFNFTLYDWKGYLWSFKICCSVGCTFSTNTSHSVESSVGHDTSLTDDDYLICVELANSSLPVFRVKMDLSSFQWKSSCLTRTLTAAQEVVYQSLHPPCADQHPAAIWIFAQDSILFEGQPVGLGCCENHQACETFFLHPTLKAYHRPTLCEITIIY